MLKLNLANLQLRHKGGGSTSNGRGSQAKRLGAKADGQTVTGGSILRQRGIPSTQV